MTLFKLLTNELPARAPREGGGKGGTWLQRWERRLCRWEWCLVDQVRSRFYGSVSTMHRRTADPARLLRYHPTPHAAKGLP